MRLLGQDGSKSILIAGGVIQWIGASPERPPDPPVATTLDGHGATALPGLIDSHVHFDALAAAKDRQSALDVRTEIFPITMRQTLASGVTTARVHLAALDDLELMKALAADDCFPAPRMALAGPGLLGGAPEVDARLMRGVAGPDDAKDKVATLAQLGAEWVALHGIARFADAELDAIVAAAADAGVQLMADTDGLDDLEVALRWPVSSGEYLNRSQTPRYPESLMAAITARDGPFFVVPPVGYYRRSHLYARGGEAAIDPAVLAFVDEELAGQMRAGFADEFERDPYVAGALESYPTHRDKFHQLRTAGARLVIGSDSGSLGQFHYDAVWQEMAAWHVYGVAPDEVVAAATTRPAGLLRRSDVGVIAAGARGDVVLYDGDIAAGSFERAHVRAVVKGGVVFVAESQWVGPDRAQMLAMMGAHE
ncbi:amidohydrolase family protein [Haliangium sp.]|uniref:amidohydrolase family protein n=1 Tax=Haliangium sp. TaxID=2663208 RepID=UPI003D1411AB